jgi:hypothetical protein
MAVTYSFANQVMDYIFGKVTYTPPTNWYLGVSTTTIQNDGTGATEPTTDPAYSRLIIPNIKTSFTTASNGMVQNSIAFQFSESQIDWGTVTDFLISDSATGGSVKLFGKLVLSRFVESGTLLFLEIGALQMTMTNISA